MRIAFSSKGDSMDATIDPRFGRAAYLVVFDEESKDISSYDNRSIDTVAHGAGPQTAQKLLEMEPDVFITGNGPGGNASAVMQRTNVKIYIGASGMTLQEAYDAWKRGALTQL